MNRERSKLAHAKRIVVKIGTRSLLPNRSMHSARFDALAAELASALAAKRSVVLVSSGAVALGCTRLGFKKRPTQIQHLQAAAAVGQSQLMRAYEEVFEAHNVPIGQVLLTHSDLADRERYLNARGALEAMLEANVVPIINENDTVSAKELKFGDNDQLAAMVATLVGAELLVLLTDVEGILDNKGKRIPLVKNSAEVEALIRPQTGSEAQTSLGGMRSKLDAAVQATKRGVAAVIADARDSKVIGKIIAGEDVGTLLLAQDNVLSSRKHWIAYTLKMRGVVIVDEGAARALVRSQRSLLPAGVLGVRGAFDAGDAVSIIDAQGHELGRGLSRYGVREVAELAGSPTQDIAEKIGYHRGDEIIHRDDLVVLS